MRNIEEILKIANIALKMGILTNSYGPVLLRFLRLVNLWQNDEPGLVSYTLIHSKEIMSKERTEADHIAGY